MNFTKKHLIITGLIILILLSLFFIIGEISFKTPEITQYIPPVSTQTAAVADFDSSLVAHYTFDDNVNDSAGSNNGTIVGGATYVDGKVGRAISISSVDDRVSTPSDFIGAGDVTVCAWYFAKSARFASKIIDNNKFSIGISTLNRLTLSSNGGASGLITTDNIIIPNTWTHICATRSSSGIGAWYINGVADRTGSTGVPVAGTQHISLGNHPFTKSGWDGYIDDVRIYSSILKSNQVAEIYNLSNGTVSAVAPDTIPPSTPITPPSTPTIPPPVTTQVQQTGTAISCSREDVQAAINSAQDGDTVIVPAGNCTWTTAVSRTPALIISKSITLKGAGIDQTIISDGTGQLGEELLIRISGKVRITGFTFNPATPKLRWENIIMASGQNWRIDHNKFDSFNGSINLTSLSVSIASSGSGVADHNIFNNNENGVMIFGQGDISWTKPSPVGTADAVYIEDNTFNFKAQQNGAIDAYSGASYVFRFNTVNGTLVNHHGFDSGGYRSPYTFEIYNNTFDNPYMHLWTMMSFRGGSGLIFNNTASANGGSYDSLAILENFRSSDGFTYTSFGICNGLNPYDGNTPGGEGYPCRDQIGRGINQTLTPVYLWNNSLKGNFLVKPVVKAFYQGAGSVRAITYHILENRDFYNNVCPPNYTPYTYPHPLVREQDGVPTQTVPLNCPELPTTQPPPTFKPGDFDHDGSVNVLDFSAMKMYWNHTDTLSAPYDLNRDGTVNTLDYAIMVQGWTG